ncbi:MAG: hypothetical protein WKG07_05160 [Hymenobacter sp.]
MAAAKAPVAAALTPLARYDATLRTDLQPPSEPPSRACASRCFKKP